MDYVLAERIAKSLESIECLLREKIEMDKRNQECAAPMLDDTFEIVQTWPFPFNKES